MSHDPEILEAGVGSRDPERLVLMREKLQQPRKDASASLTGNTCIYRVRQALRERNKKLFIPQIVSLGPYHHGKPEFSNMEDQKWRILGHVLQRQKQDVEHYFYALRELEKDARSRYEGPVNLPEDQFVEMMVLDGLFVVEFLLGCYEGHMELGYSSDDVVFSNRGTRLSIKQDMIKLENQLPLFILDKLQGLRARNQEVEVAKIVPFFFHQLRLTKQIPESFLQPRSASPSSGKGDLHCLDVFRKVLLEVSESEEVDKMSESKEVDDYVGVFRKLKMTVLEKFCCCFPTTIASDEYTACAIELKDTGVKFKERKTNDFWDIKFKNGILKIPQITIYDSTKLVLLNLIAFEQCHRCDGDKITAYYCFMDHLIDSEQDVAYLRKQKIVHNRIGSDAAVAALFNDLGKDVIFDYEGTYLCEISKKVDRYSQQKCNIWSTSLKHKYFNNPWSGISLLAATILLVLTLVQTIFAVKDYYKP